MPASETAGEGRASNVSEAESTQETPPEKGREAGVGWYVVQTKQHCEEQAVVHLGRRGVRAYLPKMRQWPRPAVGSMCPRWTET